MVSGFDRFGQVSAGSNSLTWLNRLSQITNSNRLDQRNHLSQEVILMAELIGPEVNSVPGFLLEPSGNCLPVILETGVTAARKAIQARASCS